MKTHPYLIEGRLPDVLALIQALALSPMTRRSEEGLVQELQGTPSSASSWIEIGLQHREFFRVKPEGKRRAHVSLIARNVQEPVSNDNGDELRPTLHADTTAKLMALAVDLHAQQTQRKEAWKTVIIPITVAVLAAVASISAAFISAAMRK
ncbi:hypothetical protein GTP41_19315 [Pseudoduganella sp. DS3]|uniref:Uncharacterized protein n=1 Tax=Pseudoduganella guangdongensis TaxID=2692179 RepID=A0A6N9HNG1_9BURK|nr:hypothetical protein [Pseudoduganella guangdongensis]MYN04245.1 hypothetical protein [Pseudoduganella guangdongensis]